MKRILILSVLVLMIISSCEKKDEETQSPANFSASDGTAVGTVYIDFELTGNSESVEVYRKEKGAPDSEWQLVMGTGTPYFDQNGYYGTGLPQGKVFEYKIRSCCGDQNKFTEIDEGYAYEIIPVTSIEITPLNNTNFLVWNEGNNESFLNDVEIRFDIYRSEQTDGPFEKVGTADHDRSYTDNLQSEPELQGKSLYYRIDTWFYPFEQSFAEGTIIESSGGSGGNSTITYNSLDLGQIASSMQGGISQILEKNVDGTLYFGVINDAEATGYGKPELYRFNGSSWQNEWSTVTPNVFNKIHYAIASGSHYVAGVYDSLCVYQWNGSAWSENLTPDNLGQADSPSEVSVEIDNDNLYMALTQYPDYDLQVLKYTDDGWDTVGGDVNGIIASGNIQDVTLEKIDGGLYLYYLIDNTLHIKHLNGTSWETDLTWTKDNIADIDIAKNGSDIYFISGSSNSIYRGGVYKITSATTVDEIISNSSEEWFQFPLSIAIDSEDHVVVASLYFESATSFYPFINVYNGTDWNTVSGDFSDGIDPVSISTNGTDIYYIYGDASSENASGDPTIVKSKKLSK